jgi:hypothetical protein
MINKLPTVEQTPLFEVAHQIKRGRLLDEKAAAIARVARNWEPVVRSSQAAIEQGWRQPETQPVDPLASREMSLPILHELIDELRQPPAK